MRAIAIGVALALAACGPVTGEGDAGVPRPYVGGIADGGPDGDAGPVGGPDVDAGPDGGDAGAEWEDGGAPEDGGADAAPDAGADAGNVDGGPDGGEADAGADAGTAQPDFLPGVLYPADRTHSPITPEVAAGFAIVAGRSHRQERVFAKVGDSISTGWPFLYCFAGSSVDLDGRDALFPTLEWFRAGQAAGTTAFDRPSLATEIGLHAFELLEGSPSRLDREVSAIDPRFAAVMVGTNDVRWREVRDYAPDLLRITDNLLGTGVVPILSTLPPREDQDWIGGRVTLFNLVVRGIAQGRQVPLIDLHRELLLLPGHGLADDGVHLNNPGTEAGTCSFTPVGLAFGATLRNLLTLEALHRTRLALHEGVAGDPEAAGIPGAGTAERPARIESLPFVDLRHTANLGEALIASYPGCEASGLAGPEVVYELAVTAQGNLHLHHLQTAGASRVLLLDETGTCRQTTGEDLTVWVGPGLWRVVVDGPDPAGAEYLLVLR